MIHVTSLRAPVRKLIPNMTALQLLSFLFISSICCICAVSPPAHAETTPSPITVSGHNFFNGIIREGINPGGKIPGTDDPSCVPSPQHKNPVVVLHGTFLNRQTGMASLIEDLQHDGYCVWAPTYGNDKEAPWPKSALGGATDIRSESAPEIAAYVDKVLAQTGAEKVDVVGHSQGTVQGVYLAAHTRPGKVAHVVAISPVYKGSASVPIVKPLLDQFIGPLPAFPAANDVAPGSDFLKELTSTKLVPDDVQLTNVVSRYDEIILPYTSGIVPETSNIHNVILQDGCPQDHSDHLAITASPRTIDIVKRALDPTWNKPISCVPVSPLTGSEVIYLNNQGISSTPVH
ncbi:alpha/beta fold hydrolase [Corynebacterium poyangense]|uniref:Alpha/beta fold hydrolase n=1 Tax=Corynebacterium poyangense TaxID=2684405 RepID=A0A7H0SL58_9CORY|nr:alpha/beta fold hydrolase [Corynebacterium poyangense]QNQ89283.1 alpha/beta fold hydrolase [Corynebacterium poyangense]